MNNKKLSDVKSLYTFAKAKWYDPFLRIWNPIAAHQAERHFLSFLKTNLTKETAILELGCGTADNMRLIMEHQLPFKSYLGLDFTPDMLAIAHNKWSEHSYISFQEMDLNHLDQFSGKYDLILCTWVLSHIQKPSRIVNASQEYLNPGGKAFFLFLTKPQSYIDWWLSPFVHHLFRSQYVSEQDIRSMKNIQERQHFSHHLITTLITGKPDEINHS